MKRRVVGVVAIGGVLAAMVPALVSEGAVRAGSAGNAVSVRLAGTATPATGGYTPSGAGDVTQAEFAGEQDDEVDADAYPGIIVDRSLSHGTGHGASVNSGKKAK